MLTIEVQGEDLFDEETSTFTKVKSTKLLLEHSLISISKWESIYHKPFISSVNKTIDETMSYIKCMTITPVSEAVYLCLSDQNIKDILAYIDNTMTATTFSSLQSSKMSREVITSELMYYWMVSYRIPPEYQKWHLNRLITLIKICNIRNSPAKKMSQKDINARNARMNKQRRQQMNSKG